MFHYEIQGTCAQDYGSPNSSSGSSNTGELHYTNTWCRNIASLGALITILSIGFDPLLQLLVTYPGSLDSIPGSPQLPVTIARSDYYNGAVEAPQQGLCE